MRNYFATKWRKLIFKKKRNPLTYSPALYNIHKQGRTRMLPINVSIPNLTVAHLEQFRAPQLPNQSKRPTDVRVDWIPAILHQKSLSCYLPSEAIYNRHSPNSKICICYFVCGLWLRYAPGCTSDDHGGLNLAEYLRVPDLLILWLGSNTSGSVVVDWVPDIT